MFFPEKIISIQSHDRVLEVGPGGEPFSRSDVLLEKRFRSKTATKAQRGYTPVLKTNKRIVYFDGTEFPFKDKEFDYVICSQVLEHVANVETFMKEIFRVARRGYVEYPLIYYDYVYNIPEHLNFLKYRRGKLQYLKKSGTHLAEFSKVSQLFYRSLVLGYKSSAFVPKKFLMEGFEWFAPFPVVKAQKIADLCWSKINLPAPFSDKSDGRFPEIVKILKSYVSQN